MRTLSQIQYHGALANHSTVFSVAFQEDTLGIVARVMLADIMQ